MANRYISQALADLSQDIAGAVPVDIVKKWIEGDGSELEAGKALDPYRVTGTVVSTDASGLSKLSREKDLLDVLKLVSDPKEIIYGCGRAVGGNGLGRWVADNTEMFYDGAIPVPEVVNAMVQANDTITNECGVLVGFGIHCGTFLNIGGGMYGKDADFVETVAENNAAGDEILVSESVAKRIAGDNTFVVQEATELRGHQEPVFRVKGGINGPVLEVTDRDYPICFDRKFF